MKILLAGESWVIHSTHIKGFDQFSTTTYEEGGKPLINALKSGGFEVDYMPSHIAATEFPSTPEELSEYGAIILSDIGSNTLLLTNETFSQGIRMPNRLCAIRDYVKNGGGFAMMGGYMSFQGIDAKARYAHSPIEEALPVRLLECDDRRELPEGVTPEIVNPAHPILEGVPHEWPYFLGYNILEPKAGGEILAKCGDDVFLAAGSYGKGRAVAFASDIAPHWGSPEFVGWAHYNRLFSNMAKWLSGGC